MALPVSPNTITANNINVELGRAGTAAFSINGADERALAGVASGQISFSDFHGKSAGVDINLANRSIQGTSGAGFRMNSDGTFDEINRELNTSIYAPVATWWMDPAGGVPGSNYELEFWIYDSNTSLDNTPVLYQYTRYSLGTTRELYFNTSVGPGRYIDMVVDIYEAGTSTLAATGLIYIYT